MFERYEFSAPHDAPDTARRPTLIRLRRWLHDATLAEDVGGESPAIEQMPGIRRNHTSGSRVCTVRVVIHQCERECPHARLPQERQDMLPQSARGCLPSFRCTRVWCQACAYE